MGSPTAPRIHGTGSPIAPQDMGYGVTHCPKGYGVTHSWMPPALLHPIPVQVTPQPWRSCGSPCLWVPRVGGGRRREGGPPGPKCQWGLQPRPGWTERGRRTDRRAAGMGGTACHHPPRPGPMGHQEGHEEGSRSPQTHPPVPRASQSLLVLPVCSQSCPLCAPSPPPPLPSVPLLSAPGSISPFLPVPHPCSMAPPLLTLSTAQPRSSISHTPARDLPHLSTPPPSNFCTPLPTPTPDPSVLHLQAPAQHLRFQPSTPSAAPPVPSQHTNSGTPSSILYYPGLTEMHFNAYYLCF